MAEEWDETPAAIPCTTASEFEIYRAAYEVFCYPTAERLEYLEQRLLLCDSDTMHKTVLVIQAANLELDAESRQVTATIAEQGGTVFCGPGCTGCCSQLVVCQGFEASLLGMYLCRNPELKASFLRRWPVWDAQTRAFRESFLAWGRKRYREGVDDGTYRLEDYSIPCPFLEKGRCLVYPVRPYVCRSCMSVSEQCPHPSNPDENPGLRTQDLGAQTLHQKTRRAVAGILWRQFGLSPREAGILPELVWLWLEQGEQALLDNLSAADTLSLHA